MLGYFGRTPLPPDPAVVREGRRAARTAAVRGRPAGRRARRARTGRARRWRSGSLPVTDENVFLVAAAIVPGKHMDLNEGIRLLAGNPRIVVPLNRRPVAAAVAAAPGGPVMTFTGPFTHIVHSDRRRHHAPLPDHDRAARRHVGPGRPAASPGSAAPGPTVDGATPVYSPFGGKAQLVDLAVKVGDQVVPGQVVAAVEVMKARHDIRAPCAGRVLHIDATLGADVTAGTPIMLIGQ